MGNTADPELNERLADFERRIGQKKAADDKQIADLAAAKEQRRQQDSRA